MASKTPIKKVVPKEKVAILHSCTENQRIRRIELILVGNGDPTAGYVYKVIEMGDAVKTINEKLTGISAVVKELHEKSIGKNAVDKTEKELKEEKRVKITMWLKTLSFIIGAIGLCVTAYFSFTGTKITKESKEEITTEIRASEGVSKVTRSGYVRYNDRGLKDSVKIR